MTFAFFAARLLPGALACVSLLLWALAGEPAQAQAAERDLSWAHERSDIKPDPRVKFGKLANGMRYALLRNGTPANAVSVYFRIAAGSLHETDEQRGLAHFLEHLAFQGSKNVARGEMLKILQRLGASPGADANAYTSFDETVYQFELPKADAATIDTALMLLREIADRLSLTQEAMEAERGVVVEELKLSDQPTTRNARRQFAATFGGMRHLQRWPIGERSVIETAPVELVRKFYQQYYRPERGLLVIVGEIDRDAIEAKVAALFADWKQPGPAGADPDLGQLNAAALRADHYSEPSLREQVNITWARPDEQAPPTKAEYAKAVRRSLAFTILNRRLGNIAGAADAPFAVAELSLGALSNAVEFQRLAATAKAGEWKAALGGLEREARRFADYGVSQIDLNRELRRSRAAAAEAAKGVQGWTNAVYAVVILASVNSDFVFAPIGDLVARWEEALQGLTATDVYAIAQGLLKREPSLIFVSSPNPIAGGTAEILQAYREAAALPVAAPPVVADMPFPYATFGRTGKVAQRRDLAEFAASEVKFANGVRLHVKTTDFADEIGVIVRFAGGMLDFPRDRSVPRYFYSNVWVLGGLKEIDIDRLADAVTGRSVGASAGIDEDAYQLAGATNAADFTFQMQVLAAFATDPAYRPQPLERLKIGYADAWRRRRATPRAALSADLGAILHSKDARWVAATPEEANAVTAPVVRAMLEPVLKRRPLDVTIVGNISVDAAVEAVAKTFGALPARARTYTPPAGARDVRFPAGKQQITLTHDGGAEQAIALLAWPGPDFYADVRRGRAFRLLAGVLDSELGNRLRALGKTYSVNVSSVRSTTFPGYGYLTLFADTAPASVDEVYREFDAAVASIRDGNLSDDAILRVRTPLINDLERNKRSNAYWLNTLVGYQSDARNLAFEKTLVSDYREISKAEIVEVARAYLNDARRVEIRVLPAAVPVASLAMRRVLESDWLSGDTLRQLIVKPGDPTFLLTLQPGGDESACVSVHIPCSPAARFDLERLITGSMPPAR
jgi:zinc protease